MLRGGEGVSKKCNDLWFTAAPIVDSDENVLGGRFIPCTPNGGVEMKRRKQRIKDLPHVTDIIGFAGLIPDYGRWQSAGLKQQYGLDVHELVRLAVKRKANLDGVQSKAFECARQFSKLLKLTGAKVIASEKRVYRETEYQGRIDLVVQWEGVTWLWDIKTGASARWHGVQLAAYCLAYSGLHEPRAVVEISGTSHKLVPFTDHDDYEEWSALVTHWKWSHKS
jgi:hypothetical protein